MHLLCDLGSKLGISGSPKAPPAWRVWRLLLLMVVLQPVLLGKRERSAPALRISRSEQ